MESDLPVHCETRILPGYEKELIHIYVLIFIQQTQHEHSAIQEVYKQKQKYISHENRQLSW